MQIVSNDDREAQTELQGLLCGSLQASPQPPDGRLIALDYDLTAG